MTPAQLVACFAGSKEFTDLAGSDGFPAIGIVNWSNDPPNVLSPFTTKGLPSTADGPGFAGPLVVTGKPADVPVGGDCMCGCSPNNSRQLTKETSGPQDQSTSCTDFSQAGVRYATGAMERNFTDLQSTGYGLSEGMTRSFTNAFNPTYTWEGSGMVVSQQRYPVQNGTGVIVVLSDADAIYFDQVGTTTCPTGTARTRSPPSSSCRG
jgi:hypothetical protein